MKWGEKQWQKDRTEKEPYASAATVAGKVDSISAWMKTESRRSNTSSPRRRRNVPTSWKPQSKSMSTTRRSPSAVPSSQIQTQRSASGQPSGSAPTARASSVNLPMKTTPTSSKDISTPESEKWRFVISPPLSANNCWWICTPTEIDRHLSGQSRNRLQPENSQECQDRAPVLSAKGGGRRTDIQKSCQRSKAPKTSKEGNENLESEWAERVPQRNDPLRLLRILLPRDHDRAEIRRDPCARVGGSWWRKQNDPCEQASQTLQKRNGSVYSENPGIHPNYQYQRWMSEIAQRIESKTARRNKADVSFTCNGNLLWSEIYHIQVSQETKESRSTADTLPRSQTQLRDPVNRAGHGH